MPEVLGKSLNKYIRIPVVLFLAFMWATAGAIVLITFTGVTSRVLNPEMNNMILILFFCIIGCWAATRRSTSLINGLEIIIIVTLPIVVFIVFKALSTSLFYWDSVAVFTDYALEKPMYMDIAAGTYPFTGYINLSIYNRMYKNLKIKHLWLVPVIGSVLMLISFFAPIGLLGIEAVEDYLYTWIITADTLRMKFGFVERVLYLFLFVYLLLSLMYVAVKWNIAIQLIKSCFTKKNSIVHKKTKLFKWIIGILISIATFIFGIQSDDKTLLFHVQNWLKLRFSSEIILVAIVVAIAWRKGNAKKN